MRVCFQRRPVWEGTPFTRLQKQIKTSSINQKIKSSLGTIVSLCSQVILYKCNELYERDKNPKRLLSVLLKYCCTDCCLLPSKHTILYGHCGYRVDPRALCPTCTSLWFHICPVVYHHLLVGQVCKALHYGATCSARSGVKKSTWLKAKEKKEAKIPNSFILNTAYFKHFNLSLIKDKGLKGKTVKV